MMLVPGLVSHRDPLVSVAFRVENGGTGRRAAGSAPQHPASRAAWCRQIPPVMAPGSQGILRVGGRIE
ncbi:unnamed protein product [Durusdinium trenchii]|uniref:Uncharacterized protein n=2 Tax=Durusdinium trenchii TaxID=1381693 RepID=A0ABP0S6W9_9DINO